MKETLKPIHFVQFKRIKIQENLEKFLTEKFNLSANFKESQNLYGEVSTEESLEYQVDLDNIHVWLESHVVNSERRTALLLRSILADHDEDDLKSAYSEYGRLLRTSQPNGEPLSDKAEIYNFVSSILLDGMPCDKVNALIDSDDNKVTWHGQSDVHGKHLIEHGLEPKLFYTLREAFLDSLLRTMGDYTYTVDARGDMIVNEISIGA